MYSMTSGLLVLVYMMCVESRWQLTSVGVVIDVDALKTVTGVCER